MSPRDEFILELHRALQWHEHGRPRSRVDRETGWTKAPDDVINLLVRIVAWLDEGDV